MFSSHHEETGRGGQALLESLQRALARAQIPYEVLFHQSALAEPGGAFWFFAREIMKGVILRADDRFVMMVLPIDAEIDLDIVKRILRADLLRPATSPEMRRLFQGDHPETLSPPGLNPPPAYVDLTALENEKMVFSTGKDNPLIRMNTVDFLKLVSPSLGDFSLHPHRASRS